MTNNKFAPIEELSEKNTPDNVQLTDDESKGILQGNTYVEKLRELEAMLDASPRKFKRKYRNPESSFSARMFNHSKNKI